MKFQISTSSSNIDFDTLDDAYDYDVKGSPWFSPRYVLESFDTLLKVFESSVVSTQSDFQKAREARVVSIALLGISSLQRRHYVMQIYQGERPDVASLTLVERKDKPVHALLQQVEVVVFEKHSDENDVLEFLARTKLSPIKGYDSNTVILCEIRKTMRLEPYMKMHSKLKKINPEPTVMLIGRISRSRYLYQICQIWPEINLLTDIDVKEAATKYPAPHVFRLVLGADQKINIVKSNLPRPTHFEVFNLDEEKLKKKYGKS